MAPAPYRSYIHPEADAEFPAEKGRYHLYVTYSCPFACRALSARNLKGLEDVISLSVAHPIMQKTKPNDPEDGHKGWTFVDPATEPTITGVNGKEYSTEGCIPDTVLNTKYVRDLYEMVDKEPRAFSVPLLWDKKKNTIVSGESADILRTLNTGFRELVPSNVDLLPEALKEEIDAMNANLVDPIGGGMFKIVMAKEEEARLQALADYFANIQQAEDLLAKSRYLVGNGITEADIRLFHSLIRFDLNQRAEDKLNLNQYPNLVNYLRDLYQTPALKKTVKWEHLKLMLVNFNPDATASEPSIDYEAAHDRATLFAN
ncbi:Glutathione s-transferase [Globisporangium polare]